MSDALALEHPETETEPHGGLWVTDAEIIRRLGVSEKTGYLCQ